MHTKPVKFEDSPGLLDDEIERLYSPPDGFRESQCAKRIGAWYPVPLMANS